MSTTRIRTMPGADKAPVDGRHSESGAMHATPWPEADMARFGLGEVVRHRLFPLRGVIFDVDPTFANTEEWWQAIPEEIRPHKDQPFYHLLAENDDSTYVAYVSQQNLVPDDSAQPLQHPGIAELFDGFADGRYHLRRDRAH